MSERRLSRLILTSVSGWIDGPPVFNIRSTPILKEQLGDELSNKDIRVGNLNPSESLIKMVLLFSFTSRD